MTLEVTSLELLTSLVPWEKLQVQRFFTFSPEDLYMEQEGGSQKFQHHVGVSSCMSGGDRLDYISYMKVMELGKIIQATEAGNFMTEEAHNICIGAVLVIVSCCGCIGAATRNGCCICMSGLPS